MDKILIDAQAGIIVALGMISFCCSMWCVLWIWGRCTSRYKEALKQAAQVEIERLRAELARVEKLALEHCEDHDKFCRSLFRCEKCGLIFSRYDAKENNVCCNCTDAPERGEGEG